MNLDNRTRYSKLRVIVADDEPVARRLLERNLRRSVPYAEVVGEASNGYQLLSLLDKVTADILLLDIMMPGLNGLEALRCLGTRNDHMKVIIVSAYDRFEFAQEALNLGAFAYLLKPVRPSELRQSIRKCVSKIIEERAARVSRVKPGFSAFDLSATAGLDSLFDVESKLIEQVRTGSLDGVRKTLDKLAWEIKDLTSIHGFLGLELASMTMRICKAAAEVTGAFEDISELRNLAVLKMMQCETLTETMNVMISCLEALFEHFESDELSTRRLVMSAKAIIEKRAHEKLTLSDVAAEVFISPWYLSRLFKTICGTNFQDYLTDVRINRAKTLLRDTQMPFRTIGQQVGYESPSYFSKVFKQITGMSPTEFRRRC